MRCVSSVWTAACAEADVDDCESLDACEGVTVKPLVSSGSVDAAAAARESKVEEGEGGLIALTRRRTSAKASKTGSSRMGQMCNTVGKALTHGSPCLGIRIVHVRAQDVF